MSVLQAVVLGIVQGITEFLPISSSAHLLLVPRFFGWGNFPLVFDTSLHLGTALAILFYFRKDFAKMTGRMFRYLFLGSIPVVVVGFFFDDLINEFFRGSFIISIFLLSGSLIMFLAEKHLYKRKAHKKELSLKGVLNVGLAQAFALLPGISRSGVTISAGIFEGLSREEAARFSFLLSTPAVLAAGFYKLFTTFGEIQSIGYEPWLTGMLVSFVSGVVTIRLLLDFLKKRGLMGYVWYRILLVGAILILL